MARLQNRRSTPARLGMRSLACLAAGTAVVSGCGGTNQPERASAITTATSTAPLSAQTTPSPPSSTTTTVAPTTTAPVVATPATTVVTPTAPVTAAPATPVAAAACPQNLASTLSDTGGARQLITVVAKGYSTTAATLETWQRSGDCWNPVAGPWNATIGENGFSDHHIEGDGTSPTGAFPIGPTMYGNAPNPGVQEPYHQLVCGDWWDEDPRSPTYNTFQHVPCGTTPSFGGGSEALWTETQPYPSFAVIDYNTSPAVPYDGSAIFLHADTGGPTDGCVSLPLGQLDQILRWIDPADAPTVVMGPAQEITRF